MQKNVLSIEKIMMSILALCALLSGHNNMSMDSEKLLNPETNECPICFKEFDTTKHQRVSLHSFARNEASKHCICLKCYNKGTSFYKDEHGCICCPICFRKIFPFYDAIQDLKNLIYRARFVLFVSSIALAGIITLVVAARYSPKLINGIRSRLPRKKSAWTRVASLSTLST